MMSNLWNTSPTQNWSTSTIKCVFVQPLAINFPPTKWVPFPTWHNVRNGSNKRKPGNSTFFVWNIHSLKLILNLAILCDPLKIPKRWRSLHLWKGHLTIPKGSLWITWCFYNFRILHLFWSGWRFFRILFWIWPNIFADIHPIHTRLHLLASPRAFCSHFPCSCGFCYRFRHQSGWITYIGCRESLAILSF